MNPPFAYPERVPTSAVERMLLNFSTFHQTIQAALAVAEPANAQAERWRRAERLFAQELLELQDEAEAFKADLREPLLRHASRLRMLARRMNGYAFNFADDASGMLLAQRQQLLVLTAWQIAAAASGSEAAGL